ncbi:unnamed protein product [Nezara viridula]|uniref:Chitin-binding type-2 domain-containing protein n=1 Tax=Nezara viridula TaxID=85310 RepID=A0A9P0H7D0_NEZVI|nr:unnamed protein product [Nezara viridula]
MKPLFLATLLTLVFLEVTGHTRQLPKELTFKSSICDSSYSCADYHTARICRTDAKGKLEFLRDINCSQQRPYCDRSTGTCVSTPPSNFTNLIGSFSNSVKNLYTNSCSKIFSCLDCSTAQICRPTINGLVHFKDLSCSDDTPYCNPKTGTCGTEESLGCGKKNDFHCTHDGKFPDTDCDKYHICSNLTSITLSCANSSEHYDPTMGRCSNSVPCQSFSCLNNLGMKIPHPLDPRFFAFCGEKEPIVIDSCPTPYELNVTSQMCEATCHYNGLLPDLSDCRFYYKCTQVFLTESITYFTKEKKQCPNGQAYDPTQYLCVDKTSSIPGCKI